jgi:hypothetical protein
MFSSIEKPDLETQQSWVLAGLRAGQLHEPHNIGNTQQEGVE